MIESLMVWCNNTLVEKSLGARGTAPREEQVKRGCRRAPCATQR